MKAHNNRGIEILICQQCLEGLDKVLEEIRLAFSNPAFESFTSKKLQTERLQNLAFFKYLNFLIKRDLLLYMQLMSERETRLEKITEELTEIEYQDSQKKKIFPPKTVITFPDIEKKAAELIDKLLKQIDILLKQFGTMITTVKENIKKLNQRKEKIEKLIDISAKKFLNKASDTVDAVAKTKVPIKLNAVHKITKKPITITPTLLALEFKRKLKEQISLKDPNLLIDHRKLAIDFLDNANVEYLENSAHQREADISNIANLNEEFKNSVSSLREQIELIELNKILREVKTLQEQQAETLEQLEAQQQNLINIQYNLQTNSSSFNVISEESMTDYPKLSKVSSSLEETKNVLSEITTSLEEPTLEELLAQPTPNFDIESELKNMDLQVFDFENTNTDQTPEPTDTYTMLFQSMHVNGNGTLKPTTEAKVDGKEVTNSAPVNDRRFPQDPSAPSPQDFGPPTKKH